MMAKKQVMKKDCYWISENAVVDKLRKIREEKDKVHGCSCCNCGLESELWTFLWESKVEGSKFYSCERCGELIEVINGEMVL